MLKSSFIDGHYREIPYAVGPVVLFYREDFFKAAGLEPPKNWDQLLKTARALTRDTNGDGIIDIYGYTPSAGDWMAQYELHSYILANGGHICDKNGKVDFNTPETVEALKFFMQLFSNDISPPGAKNYGYKDAQTNFIAGKSAMIFTFGYMIRRNLDSNPGIVKHIRAIPLPGKNVAWPRHSSGGRNSMFIPAATKHPKEVKDFLRFLLRKENCLEVVQAYPGGNFPAAKSARESQEFKANDVIAKYPEVIEVLIAESQYSSRPGADFVQTPYTGMLEGTLPLVECVQKVLLDGWSPEKAVAWTDKKIRKLFEK
jgi:ABC-type glycerol-3-phosphate transport system substrate-binding protein